MCSDRVLRLVALALGAAVLSTCARTADTGELSASIDAVDPVCGDTAHPTAILLRGAFPADPRVSLSDPADSRLDTSYRAWLGDVELLGVTWRDPASLAATIPAPVPAGVYPLVVESPWHERVAARDGFEIRSGGCTGTPGALAVTASVAPNAVTVGQQVTLTAVVRNTGQHAVFDVEAAVSIVPAGLALAASQTAPRDVPGGESSTFTWTFDTNEVTGAGGASFVVASGGVDGLGAPVAAPPATTNVFLVNLPANVTASTDAPAAVDPDQVITFTLHAANTGAAPAIVGATLTRTVNGSATVRTLSSPTPQTVPAFAERTLVWTFSADAPCEIVVAVAVTATDLNSGRPLTVAPTPPVTVTVQRGAALATTVAAPPLVPAGQTVTVTATVTNSGQAAAMAVSATMTATPALFTLETAPGGPQTIAGGSSGAFTWVYRAGAGASRGTFSVDAAGTDANDGAPVAAARATSGQVLVAYPIGGSVSGLVRGGLVLRNGADALPLDADGAFTFPTPVANGATYSVTVTTQPPGLTCAVANGSGTMGAAPVTSVSVACTANAYTLTATSSPVGAGTLSCGGAACLASYPYSTTPMAITATPSTGYAFTGWSGDCTGTDGCTVTMTASHSVTANFTLLAYALAAVASPGNGGTLSCGGAPCQASYPYSTVPMSITAAPAVGYRFDSWSGDCSGSGSCSVVMTAPHSVTATFVVQTFTFSALIDKPGEGTVLCDGGACQATYPYSTTPMQLTAVAATGFEFKNWSGDCTGSGTCSLAMTENRSVTAHFDPLPRYSLHTSVTPDGAGTLACNGSPCEPSYVSGTVVEITAAPADGYAFLAWTGDCDGSGACVVTMDRNRTVGATFTAAPAVP